MSLQFHDYFSFYFYPRHIYKACISWIASSWIHSATMPRVLLINHRYVRIFENYQCRATWYMWHFESIIIFALPTWQKFLNQKELGKERGVPASLWREEKLMPANASINELNKLHETSSRKWAEVNRHRVDSIKDL